LDHGQSKILGELKLLSQQTRKCERHLASVENKCFIGPSTTIHTPRVVAVNRPPAQPPMTARRPPSRAIVKVAHNPYGSSTFIRRSAPANDGLTWSGTTNPHKGYFTNENPPTPTSAEDRMMDIEHPPDSCSHSVSFEQYSHGRRHSFRGEQERIVAVYGRPPRCPLPRRRGQPKDPRSYENPTAMAPYFYPPHDE